MIPITDLRIGNHVLYKPYGNRDGQPVRIEGLLGMKAFFNKRSNESGMFHHLQPIPLTEEWLKKMAFEGYTIWNKGYFELEYGHVSKCFQFRIGEWLNDIVYVHQLQNLYYSLTGEELTIKQHESRE